MAVRVNMEYKDRLFSFLFGHEENRDWTLSLYNAVNGTDYTDPKAIKIQTIREILYLGMHNDLSFLIFCEINVFEQQSTFNPNMPLRQMQYTGNQYERYIVENGFNKYGSALIPLPVPKLITFYNGTREQPDEQILRLSDAFPPGSDPDIEVRVRMININYGNSRKLLEACRPLKEYAWLVEEIRKNQKKMLLDAAVDKAIREMPKDFEILPFLESHKAEVKGMLLTEYDEAKAMELFRQDGIREGRKEGLQAGAEILKRALQKLGMSEEEINRIVAENYPSDGLLAVNEEIEKYELPGV